MESGNDITNAPVQLMQQIAAGNEQSFRQLYNSYYKKLFHFAFALVKTREAAEEIVEDVFIKIWNVRQTLTGIHNIKVYLYTATKNTSLNFLAKKAKENITRPFDHIDIDLLPFSAITSFTCPPGEWVLPTGFAEKEYIHNAPPTVIMAAAYIHFCHVLRRTGLNKGLQANSSCISGSGKSSGA